MSTPTPNPAAVGADTEVHAKAKRRRFTAEYKANVLAEIDAVEDPGGVGAILRREGLYSSHLTEWRRARAERGLSGLQPQKRGRKAKPEHLVEIEKLRRQLARAEERARRADPEAPGNAQRGRSWVVHPDPGGVESTSLSLSLRVAITPFRSLPDYGSRR